MKKIKYLLFILIAGFLAYYLIKQITDYVDPSCEFSEIHVTGKSVEECQKSSQAYLLDKNFEACRSDPRWNNVVQQKIKACATP